MPDRATSTPLAPTDAPLRPPTQAGRSFSPGPPTTPSAPDAFVSQTRAFQAIDQSILARRVGLSETKHTTDTQLEPIALSFDRQRTAGGVSASDEKLAADEEAKAEEGGGEDALLAPSEDEQADDDDDIDDAGGDARADGGARTPTVDKTVSVSHVLTNVIVLQSLLFELASLVQVRAGLFDEVRFA
jgi:hypothetical protein